VLVDETMPVIVIAPTAAGRLIPVTDAKGAAAEGQLTNLETSSHASRSQHDRHRGHTRWATHHARTPDREQRLSARDQPARLVHNGIIESFSELRRDLEGREAKFATDTDSEVIAHLVTDGIKRGLSPVEAVKVAPPRLRGAFALAFLFADEENLLIGTRGGSPLAVGFGEQAMFIGSDAIALAPFHRRGQLSRGRRLGGGHLCGGQDSHADGNVADRPGLKSQVSVMLIDKGNHRHFMAKEIHEQLEVVGDTLAKYLDMAAERVALPMALPFDFRALNRISIAAWA
jgi:glucosamine--fructose-6-phosphate aminotransferase (isomerizing)